MAYGVKYRFPFESVEGVDWTIDILKDGYSGSILTRHIGGSPMLRKDKNDNICGTSLELIAECAVDGEFEELSSSNPYAFMVKVYHSSTLVWQGYVTPEIYNAPDIAPPYDVRITATDGLGELKLNNYEPQGRQSISTLLSYLLSFTGFTLGIRQATDLFCSAAGAGTLLSSVYVNLDYMAGETCYDVLQALMATIDSTITQDGSYWLIFKETGLSVASSTFGYYENSISKSRAVLHYGSLTTHGYGFWPVGRMSREYVAPRKRVLITSDNHYKKNIFGTWTLDGNTTDEGAYISLPGSGDGLSQTVTFQEEIQKHLLLSIKVRNVGDGSRNSAGTLHIFVKLAGSYYQASPYLYLTNNLGDRRRDNAAVMWITESGTRCIFEVQAPIESDTDLDYVTVDLVIPLYHNDARSYVRASSLEIRVANGDALYPKRIYGMTLSQYEQLSGFKKIVNIDNGARGEAPDVDVVFAGTTNVNEYNGLEELLDGVPTTSAGTKITSWSTGAFSDLDFLSLIARDYALKYAGSRVRIKGTLQTNPDLSAVPVMFMDDHDSVAYIVETFSWDLYNDELSVEMISRPSASITVEGEDIEPLDGASTSDNGASSNGGWASPNSGTNLLSVWQSLVNDNTLETYDNSTAIAPAHLSALFTIETLSGGGKYLKLNTQFVGIAADGWITAGGRGAGSGSALDLDRVWESLTNNTDKPNVKINSAHIPIATTNAIGGVKVDGSTITIQNGVISASGGSSFNGGEITNDLWLHTGGANYGSKLWFGDKGSGSGYVYIQEDSDDHLKIYADKGIKISVGSNAAVEIDSLSVALGALSDVTLSSPSNGQALVYQNGVWVNGNVSGGGGVQSVTLESGTNNGTLKLTVDSTATDNIAVKGLGSLAYKSSLVAADIPDLSGTYLPLTGGTLTGDLRLKASNSNYGRKLNFGDGDYTYLYEDSDDHLKIRADKGITFDVGSSYGITFGGATLKWNATYNAWHLEGNLYADGFITAGGRGGSNTQFVLTAGDQSIAGVKTFTGTVNVNGVSLTGSSTKLVVNKDAQFTYASNETTTISGIISRLEAIEEVLGL